MSLILDLGYQLDPKTGLRKRKQKWITFRGTKKKAETRLRDLLHDTEHGTFVEPSKLTLSEWLTKWIEIAKGTLKPSTVVRYTNVIEALQAAEIGKLPLQKIRASDLEAHYATATGSASTLGLHHTVLSRALKKAKRDNLTATNPIPDVEKHAHGGAAIRKSPGRTVGARTRRGPS